MCNQLNTPDMLDLEPEPHTVCMRPYPWDKYVQCIYVPVFSKHLKLDLLGILKKETERMASSHMVLLYTFAKYL